MAAVCIYGSALPLEAPGVLGSAFGGSEGEQRCGNEDDAERGEGQQGASFVSMRCPSMSAARMQRSIANKALVFEDSAVTAAHTV